MEKTIAILLLSIMFGGVIVAGVWIIFYSRRKMREIDWLDYHHFPVISSFTRQGRRWVARYLVIDRGFGPETVHVPVWDKTEPGQTVRLAVIEGQAVYASKAQYRYFLLLGVVLTIFGLAVLTLIHLAFMRII